MFRGSLHVAALLSVLVAVSTASAHPLVERGRDAFLEADFEKALEAFERAESSDDLGREDLMRLLELRSQVHLAMGESERVEADLRKLASLSPDHDLGDRVPPRLAERFERLRERGVAAPDIEVAAEERPAGVAIEAEVIADPASLIRTLVVYGRLGRSGRWQRSADAPLVLTPQPGQDVAYRAEALGPGGAPVARSGTESDPHLHRQPPPATAGGRERNLESDEDDASAWLWVGIGGGVVAAAAIVTVAVLVAGGGVNDQTRLELPDVER